MVWYSPYGETRKLFLEKIGDLLLKNYLLSSIDVRACPKKECDYRGYICTNDLEECEDQLQCLKCETEWLDQLQGSLTFKLPKISKMKDNMTKVLFTRPCPSCGLLIQKDGGCPHMKCTKCKFEMCWFCMGSYKGYSHQLNG
jgi:hypothetical protein